LVVPRAGIHEDAAGPVRECWPAIGIQAQRISFNQVARSCWAKELDADRAISGDQITHACLRADPVARCVVDEDAVKAIWNRPGPTRISADLVALDEVARGRRTSRISDLDADELIARNGTRPSHQSTAGRNDLGPLQRVQGSVADGFRSTAILRPWLRRVQEGSAAGAAAEKSTIENLTEGI
jgi:hypothetical protein